MKTSIKSMKLLSEGGSLMGVAVITKILDLLRGSIFLKVFSPSEYGLIDVVNQIISLSKYADIGLLNNVQREYNVDVISDKVKAEKNKEIAFGIDMLLTLTITLLFLLSVLLIDYSFEIKIGILFGSLAYMAIKILKVISLEMNVTQKFNQLYKFNLFNNIVLNILIILSVGWIGIYAPLILKPIVLLGIALFWWKKNKIRYTFNFTVPQLKQQLSYGVLFSLISILFGLWVFFERFLITHFFSLNEVGIYAACLFLIKLGTALLDELVRPFAIKIRESIVKLDYRIILNYILLPSIFFYMISFLLVYFGQYLMHLLEMYLLQNFLGITEVFKILSWLIPIYSIGAISEYVLFIKGVDRFKSMYLLYLVKFLFTSILCFFYPPTDFNGLMVYFLFVEFIYFYVKQFFIHSYFWGNFRALICIIPFISLHFYFLFFHETLQQYVF